MFQLGLGWLGGRTSRLVGVFSLNLFHGNGTSQSSAILDSNPATCAPFALGQWPGELGRTETHRGRARHWASRRKTYSSRGDLLVAGLASHLEGDAIGSGVLELEGGGGQVVEVLVEEL